MRAPLLLGLGALIGGVSGAGATLWLGPRATGEPPAVQRPEPEEVEADTEPDAPSSEALEGRIGSLERRLALLTGAYAKLAGERSGDAATGDAALPSQADVSDPVFEAAVLDIFDREKERAEKEREARRVEVQTQRNERRTSELTSKLSLNERQTQELAGIVAAHYEAITRLRDGENPPQTRDEWRTRVAELSRQSDEKLRSLLSPAQFADYEKLDAEDKLGGPRGRGGGGRTAPADAAR
ncbi:MAG TPA: hypothetical protein VLC09_19195 [Polyangiaceae bacterium]|nr:hypothetical protein [Polyangiaceae bacterium]